MSMLSILTEDQKKELTNLKRKITNHIKKDDFYITSFDFNFYSNIKEYCKKKGYCITTLNSYNSLFAIYKLIKFDIEFINKFNMELTKLFIEGSDAIKHIEILPIYIPLIDCFMYEYFDHLEYEYSLIYPRFTTSYENKKPGFSRDYNMTFISVDIKREEK